MKSEIGQDRVIMPARLKEVKDLKVKIYENLCNSNIKDEKKLNNDAEVMKNNQDKFTVDKEQPDKVVRMKPKSGPPVLIPYKLESEFEKLSLEPIKVDTNAPILARHPVGGEPVWCPQQGDDVNPVKYRRPAATCEGPADDLQTPDPFLGRPEYPSVHVAQSPPITGPSSPSDSGFADSPGHASTSSEEADDLVNRVLNGDLPAEECYTNLEKLALPQSQCETILSKIEAFIQHNNDLENQNDLDENTLAVEETSLSDFVDLQPVGYYREEGAEPAQDPPAFRSLPDGAVPVTVVEIPPVASTTYGSTYTSPRMDQNLESRDLVQQRIQDKMRTECGSFGGNAVRRRSSIDIANFEQSSLVTANPKLFKDCQDIINNMPESQITKIDKNEDTLLHLYMIYSPEKESSNCPPRSKMQLLLYCLLSRLQALNKLTGPDGLLDRKNNKGQTPLYLAACVVNFPLAVQMFLHYGADPNIRRATKEMDGPVPIHKVVEAGDDCLDTLHHLLENEKTDPNILNSDGLSPLMIACRCHKSRYQNPDSREIKVVSTLKCVKALLACRKVNAFAKSASSGRAAPHYAVEKGELDLIQVFAPFASRTNPLELTAQGDPTSLINVVDRDGNNVLHILAGLHPKSTENQMKIGSMLIEMGADVTRRNGEKKIPRDLAKSMNNEELAQLFIMPKTRKSSAQSRTRSRPGCSARYEQRHPSFSSTSSGEPAYSESSRSGGNSPTQIIVTEPYVLNGGFVFGTQQPFLFDAQYTVNGPSGGVQFTNSVSHPVAAGQYTQAETSQYSPYYTGSPQAQPSPQGQSSPPAYSAQGYSPQGYSGSPQAYSNSPQNYSQGGHSPQGYSGSPQATHSPQGYSNSPRASNSPQRYSPQSNPSPQGYSPQANQSPHGYSPQGYQYPQMHVPQYAPTGAGPHRISPQHSPRHSPVFDAAAANTHMSWK